MGTKITGLADALFSKVQQRILSVLFGQPDRSFHGREIIRLAHSGVGAVQRELARLAAVELVTVVRIGNQKHYQANRAAPIFNELRGIVLKTFGVAGVLRQALAGLADRIQLAFVFGSVARGEDTAGSDVDLLIVADALSYPEVYAALAAVEPQLGRPVNPTLYDEAEWRRKQAEGNAFVTRIGAQPKIWIVGTEDDLNSAG
ncbi:MAG TPA: nucleotidyltransferase domain-containing protein [Candidatus Competibacteraceae bacterium]|nr:nucleotidyltransferase domain-containing protein [Candidatus Competibacteraceae bacterium]